MRIRKIGFFAGKEKTTYARFWEGEHFGAESGKPFTRAREPLEVLEQLRQTQGGHNFAGPISAGTRTSRRRIG
jgi:hypothetical protein